MKLLRLSLSAGTLLLLIGGYLASVVAAMRGDAADYAARVDQDGVRFLALVLLLGAVVLAFVPDREAGES